MKIILSILQIIFLLKFAIQKPIKLHFNKKLTHSKVISSSSSLFLTFKKKFQFLDYNSPNGKFDRNYENKMFDFLINNPRDLTVKSFISNYLYSIEELKK